MKKLLILIVSLFLITNLSALTLGLGVGAENLGDTICWQIKGDITLPIVSFLDYRANFLIFNLKDKLISFVTGMDNDLIIKIPVAIAFQGYIPFGFSFSFNNVTSIGVKGGIGLEKELGFLKGYLEGGLRYEKSGGNSKGKTNFYLQGGIRAPLEL